MWTSRQALEFDQVALDILRKPGCYMYVREDKAVYVGCTRYMLGRALARNHHKRKLVLEGTSLMLFPCASYSEAKLLEKQLIADLKPKYNERNTREYLAGKISKALGVTVHAAQRAYLP